MISTLEQNTTKGDAALDIIDKYRTTVDDHTRLDSLETEFNTFAHYLRSMGAGSLYLLYADDNHAGTFKWRGAFNKVAALNERGVEEIVVPSAGNHARGAVLAAKQFDMRATIVVPTTAPHAKKEGLRDLWRDSDKLRIVAHGECFDESLQHALDHPTFGTLVHPFDDPEIIAGQGTIVDDVYRNTSAIDHIVVPVGGGGLLAGLAQRLNELGDDYAHVRLHAVEPEGSNSLSRSLEAGEPTAAEKPNQRYGGSAVRTIGAETFRIILENRDRIDIHSVNDDMVDAVIYDHQIDQRDLWREKQNAPEPTAQVGAAGLEAIALEYPQAPIALVNTGHNAPLF